MQINSTPFILVFLLAGCTTSIILFSLSSRLIRKKPHYPHTPTFAGLSLGMGVILILGTLSLGIFWGFYQVSQASELAVQHEPAALSSTELVPLPSSEYQSVDSMGVAPSATPINQAIISSETPNTTGANQLITVSETETVLGTTLVAQENGQQVGPDLVGFSIFDNSGVIEQQSTAYASLQPNGHTTTGTALPPSQPTPIQQLINPQSTNVAHGLISTPALPAQSIPIASATPYPSQTPYPTATPYIPPPTPTIYIPPPPATPTPRYFSPGELVIPALDVYQTVTESPLVNNRWELRYLGKNVAWLPPSGYFPGDEFSMVFAAHVTDYDGQRGPFYHLRDLSAGNEVIYRWNGNEYRYVVTGSEVVAPYEVEKLFVNNGNGLLLVTCTNWDSGIGAYADRIIIYASLTSTTPLY